MAGFESFPKKNGGGKSSSEAEPTPLPIDSDLGEMKAESMKDYLFDQYLKQQLIEDFFENLNEYLDEEEVEEMRGELSAYDDEEVYATLSLPYELRERKFNQFKKLIEEDGQSAKELMREFVEASKRYGFSIGYHTSPSDIRPEENGQWNIKGYEKDHRDDDLSKAYYSTKYRHLFKKRDPKFIYIVRTDPATHKTDGNWSRAGTLSIVAQVPFADVVDYVENTVRDIEKKKQT